MSHSLSRPVQSPQLVPHSGLKKLLGRHLRTPFSAPYHKHTEAAYTEMRRTVLSNGGSITLDIGCGTGESTHILAQQAPREMVIGLDKSAVRLQKGALLPELGNLRLIRADAVDFLRLMHRDGIRVRKLWLLFPNPWPKPMHLARRWQGHPIFPLLPQLCDNLELRTNWQIYAEEFALAWKALDARMAEPESYRPKDFLTPFEKKYSLSGQELYRLAINNE